MKLSKGTWVHMNVAGHDPKELWQYFPNSNGRGGRSWSQAHVGEVIVMQDGQPVNTGPCKTCAGTTRVECQTCRGKRKQTCVICEGKKFIPVAWTETDNPWFNRQPDLIRLNDGRVLLGKVAASAGEELIIRLRDGKTTRVKKGDVTSKF